MQFSRVMGVSLTQSQVVGGEPSLRMMRKCQRCFWQRAKMPHRADELGTEPADGYLARALRLSALTAATTFRGLSQISATSRFSRRNSWFHLRTSSTMATGM